MHSSSQEAGEQEFHECLQGGELHFCANKIIRVFPRAATPSWSRLGWGQKLMEKEDKVRVVMKRKIKNESVT